MKLTKKPTLNHKLAAIVTAGVATSMAPTSAFAFVATTVDFSDTTKAMEASASRIPNLITTTAFVAGIALAIAGVFKIKAHVDNPAQAPLKDGMVRLAIGGALIAFPILTDVMVGAIGTGTGNVAAGTQINNLTYP